MTYFDHDIYDVIIVGLGIHGSSITSSLAHQGKKVLGIEKYGSGGHSHGSSHGYSRIIRQAYFEDPRYVPLLKRSFELWRSLERYREQVLPHTSSLLKMTGGLMIGKKYSKVIQGTLASIHTHQLEHHIYSATELHAKYPIFHPNGWNKASNHTINSCNKQKYDIKNDEETHDVHSRNEGDIVEEEEEEEEEEEVEIGIYEVEAGYLIPELCVHTYQLQAQQYGAILHFNESVVSWKKVSKFSVIKAIDTTNSIVENSDCSMLSGKNDDNQSSDNEYIYEIITNLGHIYYARNLVLSIGPWANDLYGSQLLLPQQIQRKVLYWFHAPDEYLDIYHNIPIYIWDLDTHSNFYGFPSHTQNSSDSISNAVKVAYHQQKSPINSSSTHNNTKSGTSTDTPSNNPYIDSPLTPETIDRHIYDSEIKIMRSLLREKIPSLSIQPLIHATTCMYTTIEKDEHFLIDYCPSYITSGGVMDITTTTGTITTTTMGIDDNVCSNDLNNMNKKDVNLQNIEKDKHIILVSACSGHGFKFSSVIGEIVTQLICHQSTSHDISMFQYRI